MITTIVFIIIIVIVYRIPTGRDARSAAIRLGRMHVRLKRPPASTGPDNILYHVI